MANIQNKKEKRKHLIRNLIIFVIILAAAAGVVIVVLTGTGSFSRDKAIRDYFTAMQNQDVKKYKDLCYPKEWQENYHTSDASITLDSVTANALREQSAAVGDGVSYHGVMIREKEKLSEDVRNRFHSGLSEIFNLDMETPEVDRASVRVGMNYDGGTDTAASVTEYLYKYRGKWYILSDPLMLVNMNLNENQGID